MTQGLERRYGFGHHHFVTFSCHCRFRILQLLQQGTSSKHLWKAGGPRRVAHI